MEYGRLEDDLGVVMHGEWYKGLKKYLKEGFRCLRWLVWWWRGRIWWWCRVVILKVLDRRKKRG